MSKSPEQYGLTTLGKSFGSYYKTINDAYKKYFDKYLMLHYPLYMAPDEPLEKRQKNLIDYCMGKIGPVEGLNLLDIGAGNGTLSVYLYDHFRPAQILSIDINDSNIRIAEGLKGDRNIELRNENAEEMRSIPAESVDVAVCIESAFHYPHKDAFLEQLHRVLKPNGVFVIADILTLSYKRRPLLGRWKGKMKFHHWTEEDYRRGLKAAGYRQVTLDDVTPQIRKGYAGYGKWTREMLTQNPVKKLMFLAITFVQVNLNTWLLAHRRKYVIISGKK
ncbi:MAG: class I SAM-dependent methyltransferase [Bacteroidetes bacterium]|jgi:ubiquinone/menaquinone biosynthesis C-methylase UbiE|nr:class I SAM-dependent methyltransferase [Bacteroidota bacterium]